MDKDQKIYIIKVNPLMTAMSDSNDKALVSFYKEMLELTAENIAITYGYDLETVRIVQMFLREHYNRYIKQ